ncbi:MAG: LytTR family DNA-binding domain-containing protein [Cyclobacteriaceae bacterium]
MKVLIVEDEYYTRQGLSTMISGFGKDIEIVGACETIREAIRIATEEQPEIVLLDIHLPDGNAFDFLEETSELSYNIIFITAHDNFAIRAIKEGAIDYILKPVVPDDLEMAIDKAIANHESLRNESPSEQLAANESPDKLLLGFNDCIQVISFQELMYCQSDNGYTTFYLSDGQSFLSSKPLKDFENQFPPNNFIRTHQSYILNLDFVNKYIKEGYCILENSQKVPISVRRKKQFMSKFKQYGKYLKTHS